MESRVRAVELVGGSEYGENPISKYANVNKYSVFPKVQISSKGVLKDQKNCYVYRSGIGGIVEKKILNANSAAIQSAKIVPLSNAIIQKPSKKSEFACSAIYSRLKSKPGMKSKHKLTLNSEQMIKIIREKKL